jgi:hypothetical protein
MFLMVICKREGSKKYTTMKYEAAEVLRTAHGLLLLTPRCIAYYLLSLSLRDAATTSDIIVVLITPLK